MNSIVNTLHVPKSLLTFADCLSMCSWALMLSTYWHDMI